MHRILFTLTPHQTQQLVISGAESRDFPEAIIQAWRNQLWKATTIDFCDPGLSTSSVSSHDTSAAAAATRDDDDDDGRDIDADAFSSPHVDSDSCFSGVSDFALLRHLPLSRTETKGWGTTTTDSSENSAMTLSRTNLSGYVRHVTIFRRMLTTACCSVVD